MSTTTNYGITKTGVPNVLGVAVDAALDEIDTAVATAVGAVPDNDSAFVVLVAAPGTATSAGTAGNIAYDATHIYVCIATNSWVRGDLAAW